MRAGKTEYSGESVRKPEKTKYTREDQKGNEMVTTVPKPKTVKGGGPLGPRRGMVHYPNGV